MLLYSFHLADQQFCEFDRFINRFDINTENAVALKQKDDLYIILAAIDEIVKRGARAGRFRGENNVHALPAENCDLRLYCIRLHDGAVLLGNGVLKLPKNSRIALIAFCITNCCRNWKNR